MTQLWDQGKSSDATSHICTIYQDHCREIHAVRSSGNGGQRAFPVHDNALGQGFLIPVLLSLPPAPIIPTVQTYHFSTYGISYLAASSCILCP